MILPEVQSKFSQGSVIEMLQVFFRKRNIFRRPTDHIDCLQLNSVPYPEFVVVIYSIVLYFE